MSSRARYLVFLAGVVLAAPLLVATLVELSLTQDFSDLVGAYYLEVGVHDRSSYNVVSSVIFDYRGYDTMVEQLILFAAVVGASLLLRVQRGEAERSPRESIAGRAVPPTSYAVRVAGIVTAGFTFLFSFYVILAVHVTPGGGFQSGVLLAAGLLAVYIADEYAVYERLTPRGVLERIEAISAGLYVLVGLLGLAVGGTFLLNFLALDTLGGLYGGGTIWVLNLVVGFEVTAGFVLVFSEFLEQAVLVRERSHR